MTIRLSRILLAALTAFVLAATPVQAGPFTLSVSAYDSPSFTNTNGTFEFDLSGRPVPFGFLPSTITLTANVLQTEVLDEMIITSSNQTTNSDNTTLFTATASSTITLGGITQTILDHYTLDLRGGPSGPVFTGGPSLVFDFGPQGTVTVTAIASYSHRQAEFLLTPYAQPPLDQGSGFPPIPGQAVPEPSSVCLAVMGGLSLLGYRWRRRSRPMGCCE